MNLRKLWLEPNPDQGKITAAQKEMNAVRDQMQDKMTAFRLESLKVLTPEQKEKAKSYAAGYRDGRGFGKGRGFGPGACGMGRLPGRRLPGRWRLPGRRSRAGGRADGNPFKYNRGIIRKVQPSSLPDDAPFSAPLLQIDQKELDRICDFI